MTARKHPLQCLYFTSLEELFDAIDRANRSYLNLFYKYWAIIRCHWSARSVILACILQVWSNNPMPLISHILDICLYLQVLSNYSRPFIGQIIGISWYFTSLEQLSDATDRKDRWYLLVFYKSWAIIRYHWSVRPLITLFACILQVWSNDSMPLISQIIAICLNVKVSRNYLMPLIGHIVDICLNDTSIDQLFDAVYPSDYW